MICSKSRFVSVIHFTPLESRIVSFGTSSRPSLERKLDTKTLRPCRLGGKYFPHSHRTKESIICRGIYSPCSDSAFPETCCRPCLEVSSVKHASGNPLRVQQASVLTHANLACMAPEPKSGFGHPAHPDGRPDGHHMATKRKTS